MAVYIHPLDKAHEKYFFPPLRDDGKEETKSTCSLTDTRAPSCAYTSCKIMNRDCRVKENLWKFSDSREVYFCVACNISYDRDDRVIYLLTARQIPRPTSFSSPDDEFFKYRFSVLQNFPSALPWQWRSVVLVANCEMKRRSLIREPSSPFLWETICIRW